MTKTITDGIAKKLESTIKYNKKVLNLGNNNLDEVPPEVFQMQQLETLILCFNRITELPPQLGQLTSLKRLEVNDNPISSPPPEIIRQGTKAILEFLRARLEKTSRQWVSKLLVVGEGGVGKTQLLRHLRGENFDPSIPTTHGIEIHSCQVAHPVEEGVTMTLNSWDFGGQQIYHATHQFFLTNKSLFLVAWNARLGYEQGRLVYWLETIQALAPQSPVLLVATHVDERDADIPLKDLQAKYPQIVGQVEVSNSLGIGIDNLKSRVSNLAAKLPLMGEPWPATWLTAAEELRDSPNKFMKPHQLWALMKYHGVEEESQTVLALWLHELGDLLFYPEDEELSDIIIVKPQWVSSYISKVLDDEKVAENSGVFTSEELEHLWHDLPYEMQVHFLRLMEKFDLSYRTLEDRDVSLIVERLPLDAPEYEQRWLGHIRETNNSSITMRFRLNTIPAGIPTWFIARSHRFTTYTHWRTGSLFADNKEVRHLAVVRAFTHDKYVDLSVSGPNPQDFFALLRDGFEVTLARFPGLDVKRMIPCPGHEGKHCVYEFNHEHLLNATRRKPPVMEIQCPSAFEFISIPQLLFGIHWSTQGAVIQRIDEMESRLKGEVDELKRLLQREFLKVYRREQSQLETHCPNVFVLRPEVENMWKEKLIGQRFILQLYCQAPGAWHPTDESGQYKIQQNPRWLNSIAPYIKLLVKTLKIAAPFASPVTGIIDLSVLERVKHDIKIMEELVKSLPEKASVETTNYAVDITESPGPEEAAGAFLRIIRDILDDLDQQQIWGHLRKVLTPEGHYLWLCEHHTQKYLV
jgi:GTPase SAR1 family protein